MTDTTADTITITRTATIDDAVIVPPRPPSRLRTAAARLRDWWPVPRLVVVLVAAYCLTMAIAVAWVIARG